VWLQELRLLRHGVVCQRGTPCLQALRLRQNADAFLRDQADRQTEALMDILSTADSFRKVLQTPL